MAGRKRIDIADKDLSGFKYFEKLKPLFARLHDVGCMMSAACGTGPAIANCITTSIAR